MTKKIKNKNLPAFVLAILSSLLLLLSGTTGVASWMELEDIILKYFNFELISLIFVLLLIVASFGALAVLIGGFLVLKKKVSLGKLLISLGSGAGIIGFIFNLFISISISNFSIYSFLSLSSLGVIFALLAQILSKK
jgi:hypothetical protein